MLPLLCITPVALFLIACGIGGGKPSGSLQGENFDTLTELQEACDERRWDIDEWEEKEVSKAADKYTGSMHSLRRAADEARQIKNEAHLMRMNLDNNCRIRADQIAEES